jgi:DNA helicase-2/ATP-dependent DNA helicase PcrA
MEVILETLNNEQKKAVTSNAKYLMISAGPGTGKTSTLAARILNLQYEHGLSPKEMIAISFSRSAKKQLIMKMQQYTEILGYGSIIEILTFHSLAHRIIRYGVHTGESSFRNGFQTIDTEKYIKINPSLTKDLCMEYSDRDLAGKALSKALNLIRQGQHLDGTIYSSWQDINSENAYKINIDAAERVIVEGSDLTEFWKRISRLEKTKNVTDFQGLITESIRLLNKKADTYHMIVQGLRQVLVDEYQDTSISQETLLFALAGNDKNITVVGDKNQTIYTFNGSNSQNLDRFHQKCLEKAPTQTEHIRLDKNYRSTKEIVQLSNHFIGKQLIESTIDKTDGLPVIVQTQSIKLAASFIASKIKELKQAYKTPYGDICILFRKNSEYSPQADEVVRALENSDIPYHEEVIKPDTKVMLKQEILDLCDQYIGFMIEDVLKELNTSSAKNEIKRVIQDALKQGFEDTDDLVDYIIDLDESQNTPSDDRVILKTVHSAKGQEYPIVFILYLGDRQFPHGSQPDIDEEQRLLYVGITRAMESLYILGQHGIQYDDFLGRCKSSVVEYTIFHSIYEENKGDGFRGDEMELIKKTTKRQEDDEKRRQQRLEDLMDEW